MCKHQCMPECDSAFWYSEFNKGVKCNCGESRVSLEYLDDPQHTPECAIIIAYNKWYQDMINHDNIYLNETHFQSLGQFITR